MYSTTRRSKELNRGRTSKTPTILIHGASVRLKRQSRRLLGDIHAQRRDLQLHRSTVDRTGNGCRRGVDTRAGRCGARATPDQQRHRKPPLTPRATRLPPTVTAAPRRVTRRTRAPTAAKPPPEKRIRLPTISKAASGPTRPMRSTTADHKIQNRPPTTLPTKRRTTIRRRRTRTSQPAPTPTNQPTASRRNRRR